MPANLTPQYLEAERRFREAQTPEEKIEALTEMMALMPKHKGTDKLRAMLRRRMAKLQDEAQKAGGRKKGHDPFFIKKEGAGQVVLFGLPNAGKSSLVSRLTKAACEVADYPFTTRAPLPGMLRFENVLIQLVDLPPLMDESAEAWLPRVLKAADAIAFILDSAEDPVAQMEILEEGLLEMGLVGRAPDREDPAAFGGPLPRGFLCLAKADLLGASLERVLSGLSRWPLPRVAASASTGAGLGEFGRVAFGSLGIIRVYTKAPHEKADFAKPIVLPAGSTLERAALSLHKDFALKLKYARVWGEGFFEGQMVGRDQLLHDGCILEFHL